MMTAVFIWMGLSLFATLGIVSSLALGSRRHIPTINNDTGNEPNPMGAGVPTAAEVEWARFAAKTPHYVLSNTLSSATWPLTKFVRGLDDIDALKKENGKDIYLLGGGRTTANLIEAGLVDELRLIVYPLIAGDGKALFAPTKRRRGLELRKVQQLDGGRISLVYGIA